MQIDHRVICQFRFLCTERWEGLAPISGDAKKRFCAVCNSPVYLTSNYEELGANIAAKRCVAIFLENRTGPPLEFIGDIQSAGQPISEAYLFRSVDELTQLFDVEALNLAAGITDVLKVNNVFLIGDLVNCTEAQLSELFATAPSSLSEIKEILASLGLKIGMQLDDWERRSAEYR